LLERTAPELLPALSPHPRGPNLAAATAGGAGGNGGVKRRLRDIFVHEIYGIRHMAICIYC